MTEATELKAELESVANNNGEIVDARPTVTVEYETQNGNTQSRTGEVWRVTDGGTFDDAIIRFSQNAGETDEDPYYIRIRNGKATLVSVAETREVDLGAVEAIDVDGLDTEDTNESDPSDDTDEIQEGMELTDGSGDVWLLKDINGGNTTVDVWNDGRRKRVERLPTEELQSEYQSGELEAI